MLDLMNEPDVFGMKWEEPVTSKEIKFPSLTDLYLPTMRVRPLPSPVPDCDCQLARS